MSTCRACQSTKTKFFLLLLGGSLAMGIGLGSGMIIGSYVGGKILTIDYWERTKARFKAMEWAMEPGSAL